MPLITFPCAGFPLWASHGTLEIATLSQIYDQTKSLPSMAEVTSCFLLTFLSSCYQDTGIFLGKTSSPLPSSLVFDCREEKLMN